MPKKMMRHEPSNFVSDDDLVRHFPEAVAVNGVDAGAAHRAMMRARTTAAQERERGKDRAVRARQVDVLAAEAQRGHRRPRGKGWPATLRSVRTGKAD
jgi:hypothetical protein